MNVKTVPIASLQPHPRNYNEHPAEQLAELSTGLKRFGQFKNIVTWQGYILAGHGLVEAAKASGMTEVAANDVSELSEEDALALVVADNRTAQLAHPNDELLVGILKELQEKQALDGVGYSDDDIDALLKSLEPKNTGEGPAPKDDLADELQAKWQVKLGDLWGLGKFIACPQCGSKGQCKCGVPKETYYRHYIICSDCNDPENIQRLMEGEQAAICWTDPPWNVNYGATDHPSWKSRTIENDNLGEDFAPFIEKSVNTIKTNTLPGAILYMVMSPQEWPLVDGILRAAEFHWSSTIIWAKDRLVLSRKDYHTQYEPMWYGWKSDAARVCELADRTQSDLWQIERPSKSEYHPTTKPLELVIRALQNSSVPGALVFEPFSGSGTTLLACESTGRIARACEITPKFVAVALQRFEDATNEKPELIE